MEVAQLRNSETVEGLRKPCQRNVQFLDLQVLPLRKAIGTQRRNSGCGSGSCVQEFSSG